MTSTACPRCQKTLPELTLRALALGTICPFCAAPIKRPAKREPNAAPADDGYASFELDGPPAPSAKPAKDGYASFEVSAAPAPKPASAAAPKPAAPGMTAAAPKPAAPGMTAAAPKPAAPGMTAPAPAATTAASPKNFRATMVGGTGIGTRDLPFDGTPAPSSFSLAPPVSASVPAPPARASEPGARPASGAAPAPPARAGAAALARTMAASAPARAPSGRAALAPAAGKPARTLTPAQALDLPPQTPAPVLRTPPPAPVPMAQPRFAVGPSMVESESGPTRVAPQQTRDLATGRPLLTESDDGPTNVAAPSAPAPAAVEPMLTFPDSEPIIDSVTVTPDLEAPPPAAFTLAAPDPSRRRFALLGVGMGLAIVTVALAGFKLLRHPKTAATTIATVAPKPSSVAEPVAPVVEAVPPERTPDEPMPPPRAAATTRPTLALAPAPAPRAAARSRAAAEPSAADEPRVEKHGAAASHRRVATHKAKPEKHPKHARAVAMREATPKRSAPAPAQPERADPRPPYEHGNALLFAGDGKGAIASYREAVRSSPSDPIGFRGLGLAYEQQGETALAIRALRRYLKLAPDAPDRELISRRIDRMSKRAKSK